MLFLSRAAQCVLVALLPVFVMSPQFSHGQAVHSTDRFGFVILTTAQAPSLVSAPDTFAGGVVVRFYNRQMQREYLVLTDDYGRAAAALREGDYCAEAYGTDGRRLKLEARKRAKGAGCLEIKANQTIEFSLTLAHDVKYANTIPSAMIPY